MYEIILHDSKYFKLSIFILTVNIYFVNYKSTNYLNIVKHKDSSPTEYRNMKIKNLVNLQLCIDNFYTLKL